MLLVVVMLQQVAVMLLVVVMLQQVAVMLLMVVMLLVVVMLQQVVVMAGGENGNEGSDIKMVAVAAVVSLSVYLQINVSLCI